MKSKDVSEKKPINNPKVLFVVFIILGSFVFLPTQQANADPTIGTTIYLDAQSVTVSEEVNVRGYLEAANFANLTGLEVRLELDGVPLVFDDPILIQNELGDFTANFTAPSEAGYWNLTAYFDGDATYLPSSASTIFATTELGAMYFPVTDGGSDVFDEVVPLTGFNFTSTIEFESVRSDFLGQEIQILVSQCTSPDPQERYLQLSFDTVDNNGNICLEIFPGPLMRFDDNPGIWVTIDYTGIQTLPEGYSENDIDLFHYNMLTDEITEITATRNTDTEEISGRALDIGRFIVGIGLHGEPSDGAVREHIFLGDNQQVMFRNVTNTANTTASVVSTSPEEIILEEPVTITLNYTNGNLDVDAVDTLSVRINSTSSTPDFVTIEFTETSVNSDTFTGSLTLTSGTTSGSLLHASDTDTLTFTITDKDPTDGRFKAIFDGVTEAGVVEMSDYEITEDELDDLVDNVGFVPVVGIVNMTFVDASLDEFNGQVDVTISYANALIGPVDPSALKIYHKEQGSGWDITPPAATLDTTNLLVSATFDTTTPSLFALAYPSGTIGGAGGGLGKPGVGVVLDFAASFQSPSPSSDGDEDNNDDSNRNSGNGGGANRVVVIKNEPIGDDASDATVETFPESHFEDRPLERVEISSSGFMDADGNDISEANAGQQISITSTFSNHQQQSQKYSFIVLILNEEGVVVNVAWQEGMVKSGQTVDVSTSWLPTDGGHYAVKMFVWDGFENPVPLSEAMFSNISVI